MQQHPKPWWYRLAERIVPSRCREVPEAANPTWCDHGLPNALGAIVRRAQADAVYPEADELARLRKLFQDAGSPEFDVLRLVEFFQSEMQRLKSEVKRLAEQERRVRKILGAKGMESTEAAAERIRDNTRDLLDVMRGRFDGEVEYNAIMSVAEAFAGKAGE